jgi:hypothetical protein
MDRFNVPFTPRADFFNELCPPQKLPIISPYFGVPVVRLVGPFFLPDDGAKA